MKKSLLVLLLFIATKGLAQPGDSIPLKQGTIKDTIQATIPVSDSIMRNEEMERNVSNLLSLQKSIQKGRAKEKRNAITRIAIGIALLIILVIGLRRKTVKK